MLGQWAASAAESVRAPTGGCTVYVGLMYLFLFDCYRYLYLALVLLLNAFQSRSADGRKRIKH